MSSELILKVVDVRDFGGLKNFEGWMELEGGMEVFRLYVGRGSLMGNRFVIGKDGGRDEVVEKYRRWLWTRVKGLKEGGWYDRRIVDWFRCLKGDERLGCWCRGQRCHGEVIVKCWEWLRKEGLL